ncbi:MAG: GNAT family N-acetyltransferase [Chloroflexota bacterium]|nr:GNAT family N-acetyltransferase [Chloroflexota bacterium]
MKVVHSRNASGTRKVKSRQRKRGAALMRAVAQIAREAGCYKLTLSTNLARTGAHRFYSRLGWRRTHYGFSLEIG